MTTSRGCLLFPIDSAHDGSFPCKNTELSPQSPAYLVDHEVHAHVGGDVGDGGGPAAVERPGALLRHHLRQRPPHPTAVRLPQLRLRDEEERVGRSKEPDTTVFGAHHREQEQISDEIDEILGPIKVGSML